MDGPDTGDSLLPTMKERQFVPGRYPAWAIWGSSLARRRPICCHSASVGICSSGVRGLHFHVSFNLAVIGPFSPTTTRARWGIILLSGPYNHKALQRIERVVAVTALALVLTLGPLALYCGLHEFKRNRACM